MPDIFVAPKYQTSEVASVQPAHHPRPHAMNPLSAFVDHPKGLYFATQGKGEEVELFLRRHFVTNVPWVVFSITLLLIPPVLGPIIAPIFPFTIPTQLGLVLLAFWYLAVFGTVMLTSFINWYFNVYIVTNERILDVDFVNLLYREVSSTRLNLIQDVTVKTGGVVRAIFHYGDVFIQTAGTEVNFDFHAVSRPEIVAQTIERLMREQRQTEGLSELEKRMKQ